MQEGEAQRGRIGVTMKVGVTGHINLEDKAGLVDDVGAAVERLLLALKRDRHAQTPIHLSVVSALAEGADRVVAQELLRRGAELEVVLPLPADDYELDFESTKGRAEFTALRREARRETVMPPAESRDGAYLLCGYEIAERSDVLLAVWDGKHAHGKGGTGDVVAYAREHLVPMVWISADGRHRVTPEIGGQVVEWDALAPLTMGAFDELDDYNGPLHRGKIYDANETKLRDKVKAAADDSIQLRVTRASQWVAPYFARAESQANFCQAWYKRIGVGLLVLSFAAVALVAGQELFIPHDPDIVWVEVAFLIAALVGLLIGWKCRFHDRWITARYLGESLRSALFLAVAGIGDDHLHRQPRLMNDEPTDAWVRRAFAEVWAERPIWHPTEADVGPLQRLLAAGWIGDQLIYYDKAARKHARVHKRLTVLAYVFFVISVAAAVLHSLNVAHGKTESFALWGFLSIVIPAAAGALSGLAAQREFHQHAQRYGRMTRRLTDAKLQMEMATDLVAVQRLALKTEKAIREESGEWFGVVRLHDLELPS